MLILNSYLIILYFANGYDVPSLKVFGISFNSAAAFPTSFDKDFNVSGPNKTRATTKVTAISAIYCNYIFILYVILYYF